MLVLFYDIHLMDAKHPPQRRKERQEKGQEGPALREGVSLQTLS